MRNDNAIATLAGWMSALPELNALYQLAALLFVLVVTQRFKAMAFLAMVAATGIFGLAQGAALPWTAKEFNTGFGQTIAAAGLAILAGAMLSRLAEASGAAGWWGRRFRWPAAALFGAMAGVGGTPIGALAVLAPVVRAAGAARRRAALAASSGVIAAHGCLLPSPLPIAALAILGGDWRLCLLLGLPVAAAQILLGLILARGAPDSEVAPAEAAGSPRAAWGALLAVLVMIALIIAQGLGQIPSEPFGGGTARENLLGLGRPMILLLAGLGFALLAMGANHRTAIAEDGWLAQGARQGLGVFLAVGAAGGFQMVLHNNGMAELLSERLLALPPGLGVAIPFVVALVNRAIQGSPLSAAITAAGMMQPLLPLLGLESEVGRALAAVAVGAGAMAAPHLNDGYFWLAADQAGLSPLGALRRITGAALAQGTLAVAVLVLLAWICQ